MVGRVCRMFCVVVAGLCFVALARGQSASTSEPLYQARLLAPCFDAAAADYDGDGVTDLVLAEQPSGQLSFWRGLGNGTFADGVELAVDVDGVALEAGDVDEDGVCDLVVRSMDAAGLVILLGVGYGAFLEHGSLALPDDIELLPLADIDGDDGPDVLVISGGVLLISLGVGDGTFALPVAVPTPAQVTCAASVDLDGDGDPDVVVGLGDSRLALLVNSGGLHLRQALALPYSPACLAVGDLDGDAAPDVAIGFAYGYEEPGLGTLLGVGDGFLDPDSFATVDEPLIARDVFVGSFDDDGLLDLAVLPQIETAPPSVRVFSGDGAGGVLRGTRYGTGAKQGRLADFDGDERSDLVLLGAGELLLGREIGFGPPLVRFAQDLTPLHQALALGDFDGDGVSDLAVTELERVTTLRGLGDGLFERRSSLWTLGTTELASGDFDEDGLLDLVRTTSAGFVDVLVGDGTGAFALQPAQELSAVSFAVEVADVNADGHLDLGVCVLSATHAVEIGLGRGDGTFELLPAVHTGEVVRDLRFARLDGDAQLDLAAIGTALRTFRGDGSGGFVPIGSFASQFSVARAFDLADLDGDGQLDAVMATANPWLDVFPGVADGSFGAALTVPLPDGKLVTSLRLIDGNGDGNLDVVGALENDSALAVWPGVVGLGFGQPVFHGMAVRPEAMVVGEFGGSGQPDVALACRGVNGVVIQLGPP